MDVLAGGRWFRSNMECVEFATKHITEGHFQWFIDIVIYLQFVTGYTVSTAESKRDKENNRAIDYYLSLKKDVPLIFGVLSERKELTTPLTAIRTPELWNSHDGVRWV